MDWSQVLVILIGGGGVGAILSVIFQHINNKKTTDIQLLDRAYREIERLDDQIDELEAELKIQKNENKELELVIADLRESVANMKRDLEEMKRGVKNVK